ncbi:MAG: class I tRNA ligase family protein, partial [Terriglobia bacterium]
MSYKDTLNLPKTAFPMKADLARREPEILKFWEKIDHYRLVLEKTKDGDRFVLHDGPPYANGDIHLGHTLNKVLKDVIVKYKSMRGYFAPYVPGWDCHGQPIEYEVEKRLGPKKGEMATEEFRRLCRDYAERFVARQKNQFKRLGIRGDWEKPYLTFDPEYEATNVRVFGSLFEKGMISRGKKPIHWCHHCETALAEAEIEYNDEESPSVYVRFPVTRPLPFLKGEPDSVSVVIWTTTPWTLPANVAIAVHPDLSYAAVATGSEILIVAEDLVADLMSLWGFSDFDVLAKVEGRRLAGVDAVSPLSGAPSEVVVADFVDLNQGTGCVHIAPGHGEEDYQLGLKHGLAAPMPVDRKGFLTEQAGRFAGAHISAANDHIVDFLREEKALVASSTVSHSYPHCWRCKKPVIFRATEQWFVRMDEGHLRETALKSI